MGRKWLCFVIPRLGVKLILPCCRGLAIQRRRAPAALSGPAILERAGRTVDAGVKSARVLRGRGFEGARGLGIPDFRLGIGDCGAPAGEPAVAADLRPPACQACILAVCTA